MITIPFDHYVGEVNYDNYDSIVRRCLEFDNVKIFGKDQSGEYDMFYIRMGTEGKPPIFLTASIHGPEWQTTSYSLSFFEQIRDDTYPDKDLRDNLLENFNIYYFPMLNPYGYDRVLYGEYGVNTSGNSSSRNNAGGKDLNRDFYEFSEIESILLRSLREEIKPFSYLDMHMYQPDYPNAQGNLTILGNGQSETNYLKTEWADAIRDQVEEEILVWIPNNGETSGLARAYFARNNNAYTEHTLSYITEIVRPAYRNRDGTMTLIRKLTNEEIYKIGMAHLHCFFHTSMNYYEEKKGTGKPDDNELDTVNKIEMEHKIAYFIRDINGIVTNIVEEYDETCDNMIIETELIRDNRGNVTDIIRNKK